MKCPTCETDLERTEYEGESVFQCRKCTGYMVDLQRMTAIRLSQQTSEQQLKQESESWPRRDDTKPVRCPRCHSKMRVIRINSESDKLDEVLIDECELCHAVWFDPGELALMQLDYKRIQAEIQERRHEAIVNSRPDPEQEADAQQDPQTISSEDNARMLTDVLSLMGITFIGLLCYVLKVFNLDLLAGLAFVFVTFIAAWTAERFLKESGGKHFMVALMIAILGLTLSVLIWIY